MIQNTLLVIGNMAESGEDYRVYKRLCSFFEYTFGIYEHRHIEYDYDLTILNPDRPGTSVLNDRAVVIVFYGCDYDTAKTIKEYINKHYGYRDMYFWHDVYGALSM